MKRMRVNNASDDDMKNGKGFFIELDGESVANTQYDAGKEKAVIVFPGAGYTCEMPMLYYAAKMMMHHGYSVFAMRYPESLELSNAERLGDYAAEAYGKISSMGYGKVDLIGKSIGTLAISGLLSSGKIRSRTKAAWLTPLLANGYFLRNSGSGGDLLRSLFITGDADPHFDKKGLEEVSAGGYSMVVHGGDHIREIAGDWRASLGVLVNVLSRIERFFDE